MADMAAKFKECTKPHSLMHSLTGLGLGLLLVGLFAALGGQTGVVLGIILIVIGVLGDFAVNK
ncbi:MAG: hypothetical protein UU56_C0011G0013 [Candidatus Curtissbacteria bacterium GW2011_GWA2_41_24]|uniref:Uncharacterized protein n=2 Tax=Candidatus Curtissiibacteriota TaxID=1752717 RepID=A0A0G0VSX8_9BACT|nr:MAG: hypothetical protein UU56_C0011G0013 [Candidatus Curtissbacteria bacterium GW2011_GWA2_41_24]